jgi:hypothetical protein
VQVRGPVLFDFKAVEFLSELLPCRRDLVGVRNLKRAGGDAKCG